MTGWNLVLHGFDGIHLVCFVVDHKGCVDGFHFQKECRGVVDGKDRFCKISFERNAFNQKCD